MFRKIFQKLAQNWENSRSVLSAPEISLDAPIRIESESKEATLIVENDAQRIVERFLNHNTVRSIILKQKFSFKKLLMSFLVCAFCKKQSERELRLFWDTHQQTDLYVFNSDELPWNTKNQVVGSNPAHIFKFALDKPKKILFGTKVGQKMFQKLGYFDRLKGKAIFESYERLIWLFLTLWDW